MKTLKLTITNFTALAALFLGLALNLSVFAQGTAFTYQGQLQNNGAPANGSYDLTFSLFDATTNGNLIAGPLTNSATSVSNGLFTVTLDFGNQFPGAARWLQIGARTNGGGAFVTLSPLQALTATPYAIQSGNAFSAGSVGASNITGTLTAAQLPSTVVTNGASGVSISGTFSGNGAGVTNVPGTMPWQTVSGPTVIATANQGYLLTNSATTTLTLPTNANVGDIVTVSGEGTNGWNVVAAPGQAVQGESPAGVVWTDNNNAPTNGWVLVASSADGTKLVAASAGGAIYTSTNSGSTWSANNNAPAVAWRSLASSSDGSRLVAAATPGQIYTSTNSGLTWSANNNSPSNDLASVASSADGTKLVAAAGQAIYTSSDSGLTWSTNNNSPSLDWGAVASSADGTKLAAGGAVANGTSYIYTSTNSGVSWSTTSNGIAEAFYYSLASSSDGTRLVAAASTLTTESVLLSTSTNSGATWLESSPIPGTANIPCATSSADGTLLVVAASHSWIYTSTNWGSSWSANVPFGSWRAVASSADGNALVAVGQEQIWTSEPTYAGGAGLTAQFQYLGSGLWQPVSQSAVQTVGVPLVNLPSILVTNTQGGVNLSGSFSGNVSGSFSGIGAGLTNLNASQLTSGTVPDTALSTNVALRAGGNAFTGNQILTTGNVGIGTASPNYPLSFGNGLGDKIALYTTSPTENYGFGIQSFQLQIHTDTSEANIVFGYGASTNFAETMRIMGTGNVGIGTTSPDNLLTVNGSADKPGGGSWGTFSDARLKDVGSSFNHGLEALDGIQPVHYHYKSDNPLKLPSQPEYVGVVAQQVQKAVPEAVERNRDGYLVVNNDPIIWTMLNAIKELNHADNAAQATMQGLNQELKEARAENAALKARLDKVEELLNSRLKGTTD